MQPLEYYKGREQTFVKHLFLENYLERVAYNLLSRTDEFVYVDGFSGPWRTVDEAHQDTSFSIAISKLRSIRDGYKQKTGRDVRMRCFFNDNNPDAYQTLLSATRNVNDIEIEVRCEAFEDLIDEIIKFIGSGFSLTFIDPTGWTGFGLQKIQPLLRLRGETLINFMSDFVIRFLEHPGSDIARQVDDLFGGAGWKKDFDQLIALGLSREAAILEIYLRRFRLFGQFPHVTSTRVKKPIAERSYFHLVYGTRHWKGLVEFRNVESKVAGYQSQLRADAKLAQKTERTGQADLFAGDAAALSPDPSTAEREQNLKQGLALLRKTLKQKGSCLYEVLIGVACERPFVTQKVLNAWLVEMRKNGEVELPDQKDRKRTPKPGHTIRYMAARQTEDPFALYDEWSSDADEDGYTDL